MKDKRLRIIVKIAIMTALIGGLSPLSIPIGPVPISLATLVIMFSVFVFDAKYALISVVLYILLGAMGVPIFSGFTGGLAKLFGPTGGYIFGYIFIPLPFIFLKNRDKIWLNALLLLLGNILLYTLGTIWLKEYLDLSMTAALNAGVIPFLIGDSIKVVITLIIGPVLFKILNRENSTKASSVQNG